MFVAAWSECGQLQPDERGRRKRLCGFWWRGTRGGPRCAPRPLGRRGRQIPTWTLAIDDTHNRPAPRRYRTTRLHLRPRVAGLSIHWSRARNICMDRQFRFEFQTSKRNKNSLLIRSRQIPRGPLVTNRLAHSVFVFDKGIWPHIIPFQSLQFKKRLFKIRV